MAHIADIQLYKENNKYYLSASICHEDKRGIYEISIPKIKFPVKHECQLSHAIEQHGMSMHTEVSLDFGLGKLYAEPFNDEGSYFILNCIEEKVQEMTLEDIERELGYKVKIKEN